MKQLLTITALIEGATGAALFALPSVVVSLLLGVSLTEPGGVLLGRIAGASLISLATACWLSRNHPPSAIILAKALVVYNAGAAILLIYAARVENFSGFGLWPVIVMHGGLLVWCVQSIRGHKQ